MRSLRIVLASAALAALAPAAAFACPQCAQREGVGAAGLVAMGAIVTLPYFVAAVVIPAIRRGPSQES